MWESVTETYGHILWTHNSQELCCSAGSQLSTEHRTKMTQWVSQISFRLQEKCFCRSSSRNSAGLHLECCIFFRHPHHMTNPKRIHSFNISVVPRQAPPRQRWQSFGLTFWDDGWPRFKVRWLDHQENRSCSGGDQSKPVTPERFTSRPISSATCIDMFLNICENVMKCHEMKWNVMKCHEMSWSEMYWILDFNDVQGIAVQWVPAYIQNFFVSCWQ